MMERGGINLYGFIGNNPIDWFDPYGLFTFGECLQISGAFCQGAAGGLIDMVNPMNTICANQERLQEAFEDGDPLIIAGALSNATGDAILLGLPSRGTGGIGKIFEKARAVRAARAAENLESLQKAQQKATKVRPKTKGGDANADWEGGPRPKQASIEDTKKAEQKAKARDYLDEDCD
jgi:hypothetical protein